jgi:hypothetical protein
MFELESRMSFSVTLPATQLVESWLFSGRGLSLLVILMSFLVGFMSLFVGFSSDFFVAEA